MALVQQAGGQQGEVGHGVGFHGFEGRVRHDGLQRFLAQWPAQELTDALHGTVEILGAGERDQGMSQRREGSPDQEGASVPEFICLTPNPDLESG